MRQHSPLDCRRFPYQKACPSVHTDPAERALLGLFEGLELVALRVLSDRDHARDAVQETLARVLAVVNGKGVPPGYTLETYTFGILKHVLADESRRRKRLVGLPRWLTSWAASPLDQLVSRERTERVRAALSRLDREDRELLERFYWAGERVVDIAAVSGEPAERIRKRKSRALARLRALLLGPGHVPSDSPIE